MTQEKEDYSVPLIFAFIIFWFAWYRLLDNFLLSGIINIVTFIIGYITYKLWNL